MNEYKKYRWKWDNYPKEYRIDRVPIHLDIELTTRCNLKCTMCEHSFNPPEPLDMSLEIVKKIVDEFVKKGGCSIKFVYLGEPLLYQHLKEVIKYSKEKGIIDTIIATNGNLLTVEKAKEIIQSGLDYLIFSVDSCETKTYSKIRINGNLAKVCKGIGAIYMLKKLYHSKKPKTQIQIIPMKINRDEIESGKYEEFWKPFVDIVRVTPYCADYDNDKNIGKKEDFICPSVFRRMTIRANGDIVICCGAQDKRKIVGNINENTLEEAWLSRKFENVRKLMKERKSHLIDICKTCTRRLHGNY